MISLPVLRNERGRFGEDSLGGGYPEGCSWPSCPWEEKNWWRKGAEFQKESGDEGECGNSGRAEKALNSCERRCQVTRKFDGFDMVEVRCRGGLHVARPSQADGLTTGSEVFKKPQGRGLLFFHRELGGGETKISTGFDSRLLTRSEVNGNMSRPLASGERSVQV